jgi:hypothetical protein
MAEEFPIAKGKNLTTIEWFNLMSCDLTLEYDCKRISIHEYTARKLELLDRARQMEKEQRKQDLKTGYNQGYVDAQCNHINDADNFTHEYLNH